MDAAIEVPSPFELLELPGSRWCVACTDATPRASASGPSPVGFYATRDEAELAIARAIRSSQGPSSSRAFRAWIETE